MSDLNNKKINRKRLEHLERLRKKHEAKNTKTKIKKLSKIVERNSLIEKLSAIQSQTTYDLIPIAKMHEKEYACFQEESNNTNVTFSKKLRCVSGKKIEKNLQKRQLNHYETGSSSSSDDEIKIDDNLFQKPINLNVDEIKLEPLDNENDARKEKKKHEKKLNFDLNNLFNENNNNLLKSQTKEYFEMLTKIKGCQKPVLRYNEIEKMRQKLPIHAEEQQIVETINENTVILICGETGSGKTTQIPQFLYEAGYTSNGHLIGVTEPRRIAAISMAERVGKELCNSTLSSYQIRFEGNKTSDTKILFMTDGVLLRELQIDVTLSKFSVIVIDEAHERSIYSDVLIGLLSRICVARLKRGFPLKLIIMSATLRLSDFLQEQLFPKIKPKIIKVDSRQFPVTVHFERKTPDDYIKAAFKKICKIHEQLPEGGILVFLSGQREVELLTKWLKLKYPFENAENKKTKFKKIKTKKKKLANSCPNKLKLKEPEEDMIFDYDEFGAADVANEMNFTDKIEDEEFINSEKSNDFKFPPLYCLPLYSLLSTNKQKLIFEPVPENSRLCVVATNVAETSLTIPNIRYVVDSGKEKKRVFDSITGVSTFCVDWISKASADQRSGRAGRIRAGHAYRLYSSAVYEDFVSFSKPDILNQPIEQLVLHLKSMNFVKLLNFPFPTPPCAEQIDVAEKRLIHLGALNKENTDDARITEFGKTLALIPLSPQFAHFITICNNNNLLTYAISLVAILSVREPLVKINLHYDTDEEIKKFMNNILQQRNLWCSIGEARNLGDLCVLLNILGAIDNEKIVTTDFLQKLGLRVKPYFEIIKLRKQLVNVVNPSETLNKKLDINFKLTLPNQDQMRLLRQNITKSLPEHVAKLVDKSTEKNEIPKGAYKCLRIEEFVFIDSQSVLYKEQPNYILYQEIIQHNSKKIMQIVSTVEEEWIPDFVRTKLDLI